MTQNEFKRVFRIAESLVNCETSLGEQGEYEQAQIALIGYGVEKRLATARQCAIIFNAQTIFFNGLRSSTEALENRDLMLSNISLID